MADEVIKFFLENRDFPVVAFRIDYTPYGSNNVNTANLTLKKGAKHHFDESYNDNAIWWAWWPRNERITDEDLLKYGGAAP